MIGIWGPRACAALGVSNEAFPFRTAQPLTIGGVPVLAQRITYVGELGYELYVDARRRGRGLGCALRGRGRPEPVGYQALDSLRIEKGYRYFGTDLTASDTPFDSGVGFAVAKGKHPELDRNPPTRLRTLLVGGEDYLTLYGGEAVHAAARWSGACGAPRTASRSSGTSRSRSSRPRSPEGAEVQVDVLGELVPAVVAADVLYDPANERVRARLSSPLPGA